ncbi:MAG: hypothetical protein ABEJ08_02300 [Halobacteriaceae archaeon]
MSQSGEAADASRGAAERVVVSYPADLSGWGQIRLDEPSMRAYLTRTHDAAAPGEEWSVFLDVGCCGNTYDVPLRVERVEGGRRLTEATAVVFEEREACGVGGGWAVQSEGSPDDG